MNKFAPVVLLAIGIIIGLVIARNIWPQSNVQTAAGTAVTVANEYGDTETYTISAAYPQFGISAIDSDIKKTVDDAIEQFKKDAAGPLMTSSRNQFLGQFDSAYVGPDIVSTRLSLMQYTGGAHPITPIAGLNYDRASGKKLTLDDALKLVDLSLEGLAAKAKAQLQIDLKDGFQFPEGAEPKPENYATFVVSADKVTFIFQQYQVAAYAAGIQEVSFERKR